MSLKVYLVYSLAVIAGIIAGVGALIFTPLAFVEAQEPLSCGDQVESALPCIRIIKDTSPGEIPNVEFDLTFTDVNDVMEGYTPGEDFVLEDQGSRNRRDFVKLVPGLFKVKEGFRNGWRLVDIQCSNGAGLPVSAFEYNFEDRSVWIELVAGSRVICTFTNLKLDPTPTPTIQPSPTPSSTPVPTATATATVVPADFCRNIEGAQTTIPQGLSYVNGECLAPTSIPTATPIPVVSTPVTIQPPRTGEAGLGR